MKLLIISSGGAAIARFLDLFAEFEAIITISDGNYSLLEINSGIYSVIMFDWTLDFYKALFYVDQIRQSSDVPILILSFERSISQIVQALDCGADDFLQSPYVIDELVLRLKKLAGRSLKMRFKKTKININNLELDIKYQKVTISGQRLNLTATEYKILVFLILNCNLLIKNEDIEKMLVKNYKGKSQHLINSHIYNLRKKVGKELSILTIPRHGYVALSNA